MCSWKSEKRKVICEAEVIKGVGDHFQVVTGSGWRGIEDTADGWNVGNEGKDNRKYGRLIN